MVLICLSHDIVVTSENKFYLVFTYKQVNIKISDILLLVASVFMFSFSFWFVFEMFILYCERFELFYMK